MANKNGNDDNTVHNMMNADMNKQYSTCNTMLVVSCSNRRDAAALNDVQHTMIYNALESRMTKLDPRYATTHVDDDNNCRVQTASK